MLIYTPNTTTRVSYIFNFLLRNLLGIDFQLTSSREKFLNNPQRAFINYSTNSLGNGLWIKPGGLLFEEKINTRYTPPSLKEDLNLRQQINYIDYDFFELSFYLLTCYDEHTNMQRDEHERFLSRNKIIVQQKLERTPIINKWAKQFGEFLQQRNPEIAIKTNSFKHISTFDIDITYAYKYKGLIRSVGAMFKHPETIVQRIKTLTRLQNDPFDTYNEIIDKHRKLGIRPIFFVQVGKRGTYDSNNNFNRPGNKKLLRQLEKNGNIGIHPSYHSMTKRRILDRELQTINSIVESPVMLSRQHYLRVFFPYTLQNLCEAGIRKDFTLGFYDRIGFRAGTCTPFPYFNLEKNKITQLTLYPLTVMDATLKDYLNLSPTQAISELKKICDVVKKANGTLVTLWHNHSISDWGEWKGWKQVYSEMMAYIYSS